MNPNDNHVLQDSDCAYLKTLTDPKTPFLDIVRALYRANRLLCEVAQALVRVELENLTEAFGLREALNPANIGLDAWPRADHSSPWGYEACTAGARIWLPDPVGTTFWLFAEFRDDGTRLVAGLEFPRRSARARWLESRVERPDFTEVEWEGFALEQAARIEDLSQVEEALANLLQGFLTEIRRVRPDSAKA